MRECEFRVVGLTEERLRVDDRPRRPRRNRALVVALLAVLGTLAVTGREPNAGPAHVALVNGKEVRADRMLVLIDRSGSMAGTDPEVQLQLNRLAAGGISVNQRVNIPGFAISFTDSYSLLGIFNAQIAADPYIDTVYIISDFSAGDHDANDPAAYEDFVRTLRDRRLRLYWATVRDDPLQKYYEIAGQTGGGVIPAK